MFVTNRFDRRIPSDWRHVQKYPYQAPTPVTVNTIIPLPGTYFRTVYDQKREGKCVAFCICQYSTMVNRYRNEDGKWIVAYYDPHWLYDWAQANDEWEETPPEAGTSLRAGLDGVRTLGHRIVRRGRISDHDLTHGILQNRWASTVDEMRYAINSGNPVAVGVNWYSDFSPKQDNSGKWWTAKEGIKGRLVGGHAFMIHGALDRDDAFVYGNSWGPKEPISRMPYEVMNRLINEYGEIAIITDRIVT